MTTETILLAHNPYFAPGRPMSYETVLCRLAGWWTAGDSSLTPREVVRLELEEM